MSETYNSLLKKHTLSNTKVRNSIFSILKKNDKPIPLSDLVKLADSVNRSSVYRTILVFEKAGIINRLYSGWKESIELSEVFKHHHHHMTCNQCMITISFEESKILETELDKVMVNHGFHPLNHSIEFTGICSNCLITNVK